MPTGTGKTETMLTLLVHQRFKRLLIIVPTDALRIQIAEKFDTLGKLRQLSVVPDGVLNPVVGRFRKGFDSAEDAKAFLAPCNVVVATAAIMAAATEEVRLAFADMCDALFIDEAHHTGAKSWAAIRDLFVSREGKRVVQFTATPFREDGKLVNGKVVFRFPMKRAMDEKYFSKIRFVPVDPLDDDNLDLEIAVAALDVLEADLAADFDHVIMARTNGIARAHAVRILYEGLAPEHRPILVHSKMTLGERKEAHSKLRERRTRVIVCVDMLGEGFDFPNLKIAALHDPHQSLAVTLQFVGRFTRDAVGLGQATAVGSLASKKMDMRIQTLYAEDADWEAILSNLSETESGQAQERNEFLDGFNGEDDALVSLRHILPKMSTAIYKTAAQTWHPSEIADAVDDRKTVMVGPRINPTKRTVFIITQEQVPVTWGSTKVIHDVVWHLFLAHWDEQHNWLFINTSDRGMSLDSMAETLMGAEPVPIRGDEVFKGFYGIKRMLLMNVGLKHELNSRFTRFSMLVGPDVAQGISRASLGNKTRTNIFAVGFEAGRRVTIGASGKGRIWSHAVARDMSQWVTWCLELGKKYRDPAANSDTVLAGAMVPEVLSARPASIPLYIEWSYDVLSRPEEAVLLNFGAEDVPLLQVSIEIVCGAITDPLTFTVEAEDISREFRIDFLGADLGVQVVQLAGTPVRIQVGRRRMLLTEWFQIEPPSIIFSDGSQLQGHVLCKHQTAPIFTPLPDGQLLDWVWPGHVDIKKESMRRHEGKPFTTVQAHVIDVIGKASWSTVSGFDYEFIVDDDDAGESADIVAIGKLGDTIRIDLFHCKFSGSATYGVRVDDLYAVCGQSARSVRWISNPSKLLDHLVDRQAKLRRSANKERLIQGDLRALKKLANTIGDGKVTFRVFAVQPGLSKSELVNAENAMDILASVDTYLRDAVELGFNIICGP